MLKLNPAAEPHRDLRARENVVPLAAVLEAKPRDAFSPSGAQAPGVVASADEPFELARVAAENPVFEAVDAPAPRAKAPRSGLKKGDQSERVEALQRALVKTGFLRQADMNTGPGIFGNFTEAAVMALQKKWRLETTGAYDAATREVLERALNGEEPPKPKRPKVKAPPARLSHGDQGQNVEQLQRALVKAGFMTLDEMNTGPGIFGDRTREAVRKLQRTWGLEESGYYGAKTKRALEKALAGKKPPKPKKPAVPQVDLERGAKGDDVKLLQRALVKIGLLNKDHLERGYGTFGQRTQDAVTKLQFITQLPNTGYYGELSRAALTEALKDPAAFKKRAKDALKSWGKIPGVEQAIAYANGPPLNPNADSGGVWYGWCLGLVNQAFRSAGRVLPGLQVETAKAAQDAYASRIQTSGTPPRGALVFFDWVQPGSNGFAPGHIGISLGDGRFIGTTDGGAPTGVFPVQSYWIVGSLAEYKGWAYP
jgi:peptidoglycan hydrolase-like protein with peptidoglycan-binding domain